MLTDEVWEVIKEYLSVEGVILTETQRAYLEDNTAILSFEGGAFIIVRNEIDLFISKRKRGKWNIKKEVNRMFKHIAKDYDVVIAKIRETNTVSLRLTKFFGFEVVGKEQDKFVLERKLWVTQ